MKRLLLLLLLCPIFPAKAQRLTVHPVPRGIYYSMHNDDYTVRVRIPGGEWQDLYEYKVKVDMDAPTDASMVFFDFEGEVEVMVKKNNGTVRDVAVRPLSAGVKFRRRGNVVTFRLDRPRNLSIEFDGDKHRNLHLFANAPETDVPTPDAPGVLYFGEGVHTPPEGSDGFAVPSNTRIYLAPGAVVKGALLCDSVENVRIGGRGILLTPPRGVQIRFSRNIAVEDLIFIDPRHYTVFGGQSSGIAVRNIRSFSYQGWSDGIDAMSCSDMLVDGVFMRNSDDCIAIYGPRWEYRGDARNITVQNSTLWADIAHPINMGIHGYTGDGIGNVLEEAAFRNIDILEHDEDDPDYQGCMAICCGDLNLIRNILYEDIRVERIEEGQLFHIEVIFNEKYNTAPGRGIENVTLRNISCPALPDLRSASIRGLDAGRQVRHITLDNVRIGGRKLKAGDVSTNDFTDNIRFR